MLAVIWLSLSDSGLLTAVLTHLIRTDPFAFDRPRANALVFRVVSCEVAMFDESAAGMAAGEMDDFELFTHSCQCCGACRHA